MLNVDCAQNIDLVLEKVKHILVPLVKAASLNVGVRKLIDEGYLRHPRQNGVDIHLGKECSLVIDLLPRHLFKFGGELRRAGASVCLDDADDNVLAATAASNAFAEHAEGLPHPRGISEKHLKSPALLLRFAALQPIFR